MIYNTKSCIKTFLYLFQIKSFQRIHVKINDLRFLREFLPKVYLELVLWASMQLFVSDFLSNRSMTGQIIGAERYKAPVVEYVKAAPAQTLKVKVSGVLKRHSGQCKAVGMNAVEKIIERFKSRPAAGAVLTAAGIH